MLRDVNNFTGGMNIQKCFEDYSRIHLDLHVLEWMRLKLKLILHFDPPQHIWMETNILISNKPEIYVTCLLHVCDFFLFFDLCWVKNTQVILSLLISWFVRTYAPTLITFSKKNILVHATIRTPIINFDSSYFLNYFIS